MKHMLKQVERVYNTDLARSFFLNIFVFLIVLFFCAPKYEVSDDFIMENILSGAFGNSPNPHILFVNIIVGYGLLPLYKLFPGFSWYFLFLLVVGLVSLIAITYAIIQKVDNRMRWVLVTLIISFLIDDVYILPQFTKTSMVAIMSGSLLFIDAVFSIDKKRGQEIVGAFLCVIGGLIRFSSIYVAGVFVLFLVCYECFCLSREDDSALKKAVFKRAIFHGLILCGIIFCLEYLNIYCYQIDEEYKYYYEYSQARSRVVDYEDLGYEEYEEELKELGISYDDYMCMKTWNFADPTYFSLEKMQKVGDIIVKHQKSKTLSLMQIYELMQERKIAAYPLFLSCIVLGIFMIIFCTRQRWMLFCVYLIGGFLYLLLYWRNRVIYRVEFCIFVGILLSLVYIFRIEEDKSKISKKIVWIFIGVLLFRKLPLLIPDNTYINVPSEERRYFVERVFFKSWEYDGRKYRRVINKNIPEDSLYNEMLDNKNNFYFLDFSTTIQTLYYDNSPFHSLPKGYYKNFSYFAGITINHPDVNDLLISNDIYNPMKSLIDENVFLVDENVELKVEFIKEHYNIDVEAELVKYVEGYPIWKLKEI
ncbi:hypothetical protein M2454_000351 [Aequitasia blattaphilus]|uniref:Glycosyltransferase RgtA/B/C/D-like domain-containing protein n=1 Tax=Aequitasia blattaphilus TaxID=2949332 RepID=A0ABT1E9S1_9FIRM|nr:hypothetical protein [Aequitasia blattaphilus]MCP1101257.1 hypothetical protein [Aequitasia blattaphilus]MCR8613897.1 hypothetical protein [Aequitasia blattaphilus]